MDFLKILNLLTDPCVKETTCCLCLQESNHLKNVHETVEILDEYSSMYPNSLSKMLQGLFPVDTELITDQMCNHCATLIFKINILVKKNMYYTKVISSTIDLISNELSNKQFYSKKQEQLFIKFELKGNLEIKNVTSFQFQQKLVNKKIDYKTNNLNYTKMGNRINKKTIYKRKRAKIKNETRTDLQTEKETQSQKYYTCKQCEYKSINKSSRDAHVNRMHLKIRPFICDICSKGFYRKSNLTEHIVSHYMDKNEICEVCGASFRLKKTLLIHLYTHNNEKPFKCDLCDKTYATTGRKNEHMILAHQEKSVGCTYCKKMFSLKKELYRHMRVRHGKDWNGVEYV